MASAQVNGPEVKFVEANGLKFAYLEEGTGPLVLLVHGFPDTAHSWDEVRPAVAEAGFRAVSPFTRGIYPTEVPKEEAYDADTLGADIIALIDALGEETAVVVGHDWGASAAYSAAAIAPEKLRQLVTLAIPHPAAVKPTPKMVWGVRHFFKFKLPGAVERTRKNDYAYIDELVTRWSPGWDVPADETKIVKHAFEQPGCLNAALGYYRALSPVLPASHKKRIDVPTVAFAGETDILPVSAYEPARKRFNASYDIITMPGGHFMHREHPERFSAELVRALKQKSELN